MIDTPVPDEEWLAIQGCITRSIATLNRAVIYIGVEDGQPPFGYTVGNHSKNLPELLVIGPNDEGALGLLHLLSDMMLKSGKPFANGQEIKLPTKGKKRTVAAWNANAVAKDQWAYQIGQYYETNDYKLQQIVVADPNGHYPNSPKCSPDYRVPVLRTLILNS